MNRARRQSTRSRRWMRGCASGTTARLESKNYIVPGLIAVILMIIAALLTSLTIAREWEIGTMEQILSTPVRPAEMVLGKMLAYFVVGLVDMADRRCWSACSCSTCRSGQPGAAGGFQLRVPVRRAVLGNLRFRRRPRRSCGVPVGHADLVPAGVPAFRIHLLDREHAAGDPGDHAIRSGAVFHQYREGRFPERRRAEMLWGELLFLCAVRR